MEFIITLLVAIFICLFAILFLIQSIRLIIKIIKVPTSKLNSADSGLVELKGNLLAIPNHLVNSYASDTPCVWWRYTKEQQYNDSENRKCWRTIDTQESKAPLKLEDDTDICYIFPEGADVKCKRNTKWKEYEKLGDSFFSLSETYRITEEFLVEGDFLYVLGHVKTVNILNLQQVSNLSPSIMEKLIAITEPQQTIAHYIVKDKDFFVLSARKEIWLIIREIGKILLSILATIVCAWFIYMQLTK